jgi:hypothetical protein
MPGGQYTNLKEQAAAMGLGHRWPEIARCYAEVNQLFGDIVKVTPSSKVVGDMALFLFTRGIKPADVLNDLYSHLMYPEVFAEFARRARLQRCFGAADARVFLRIEAGRGNLRGDRGGEDAVHPPDQHRRGGRGRTRAGDC